MAQAHPMEDGDLIPAVNPASLEVPQAHPMDGVLTQETGDRDPAANRVRAEVVQDLVTGVLTLNGAQVPAESQARVSVQFVLNVLCVFVHLPDQID